MAQGAWPVDPGTEIGWLRIALDDADGTPVPGSTPPVAEFPLFSDAALQTVIDLYPGDRPMQIGTAYQRIGMSLIRTGQRVRVDDIEIDTRQQGADFLRLSEQWFETARTGGSGFFTITTTGANAGVRQPEGTPYPIM